MLVHMQQDANQELEDIQKDLNDHYLWLQTKEVIMKKEVEELRWVREKLTAEKVQEIASLKIAQEDLKRKATL